MKQCFLISFALAVFLAGHSAAAGTRILFAATNESANGTFELYTMTAAGADLRRITTNTVSEYGPALGPDSQRIAYVNPALSTTNIFLTTISGAPPVAVGNTNKALAVQWGSTNLFFLRFISNNFGTVFYELWRINTNGTGEARVFTNQFEDWPMGTEDFFSDRATQKVYLSAFTAGNARIHVGAWSSNSYQQILTTCSFHFDVYDPAVSPNRAWLAQTADSNGAPGSHRLYVGAVTGGCGTLVCEKYCGNPAWDPSSLWLAFTRASNSTWGGQAYVGDIWRVGSTGTQLSNLTATLSVSGGCAFASVYDEPGGKIICVATNSPSPTPPYESWALAARSIHDAVDVAQDGDTVLLTNGTYLLTNEVLVKSSVTIRSVNGPTVTVVNARNSNRVFNLNYKNAGVEGLTIINGYGSSKDGGGVYGATNNFMRNCLVVSNRAGWDGGGAFLTRGGLVEDCTFVANRADGSSYGGGGLCLRYTGTVRRTVICSNVSFMSAGGVYAYVGRIENCTIRSNAASWNAGGVYVDGGTCIRESVVEYNSSSLGGGGILCYNGSTVLNCRVVGNYIGNDFGAGIYMYQNANFVINCTVVSNRTGASGQGGGVYTHNAACYLQNSIVQYNYAGTGPNWYQGTGGHVQYCCTTPTNGTDAGCITNEPAFVSLPDKDFHLTSTSACINAGTTQALASGVDLDGNPRVQGTNIDMGCYELFVPPTVTYVATNAGHVFPYDSWANAASNIQAAVDAVAVGGTVWVTNGTYDTGGRVTPGYSLTNRVCITNALTVRSMNGPALTRIVGQGPKGAGAIRGVFMNAGTLSGFTITNCATLSTGSPQEYQGGGVWMEPTAVLTNCHVRGCDGYQAGGILLGGGTVVNCFIADNSGDYGGGIRGYGLVDHCVITRNVAPGAPGGGMLIEGGYIKNCLIISNTASFGGGLAFYSGTAINCTILNNSGVGISYGYSHVGGSVINSIVYDNTPTNYTADLMTFSCTWPASGGGGCITSAPRFKAVAAGNYHLLYGSPCIDTGGSAGGAAPTNDLEGNVRPLDGNYDGTNDYDMGCYEYNPETADSNDDGVKDWWYHKYGLNPTSATVGAEDGDGDTADNLDEWNADTIPTDSNSCLRFLECAYSAPAALMMFTGGTQALQIIEYCNDLEGSNWMFLSSIPAPTAVTNSLGVGLSPVAAEFYRVRAHR